MSERRRHVPDEGAAAEGRTRASWVVAVLMLAATALASPATAHAAASGPSATGAWLCDDAHGHLGTRTPVLLVHGFTASPDTWNDTTRLYLTTTPGTCVEMFDYAAHATDWVTDTPAGNVSVAHRLAVTITTLAAHSRAAGGPGKVIVVAHSLGGLATRCATSPACSGVPGAAADVASLTTFGTPTLGSFLRGGRSLSNAESLIGMVLSGTCKIGQTALPPLKGSCGVVADFGTSHAARAFTAGSAELAQVPVATPYPVLAVAGSVALTTSFFGHAPISLGDAGDLVVAPSSALASTHTSGNLGGTVVVGCGDLDVTGSGAGALGALALSHVTCSHISETNSGPFLVHALQQIGRVVRARTGAPCSITALRQATVDRNSRPADQQAGLPVGVSSSEYPDATLHACAGGYALAEFGNGGSCFDYYLFHASGTTWQIERVSCIRIDTPDSAPVFSRAELVGAHVDPDLVEKLLQIGTARRIVGP